MKLQEVDTLEDLKLWVEDNMPGAWVAMDSAGSLVIHTGLETSMGGYLHPVEGESENICTFCNDNAKSCSACDDGYEGE